MFWFTNNLVCILVTFSWFQGHLSQTSDFKVKGDINDQNKQDIIRQAFKVTWNKFLKASRGDDEINPITGEPRTTWGGWGVTLIDSLDTLYVMDLKEEFEDAVNKVAQVDFTRGNITTSFFEVVIRNLGGLISAYDLSGKTVLLEKAVALADLLMKDFDSPSGFPYTLFDFRSQTPVKESYASLANIGTCQLEFARLSMLTGNPKYRDIAFQVYHKLDEVKEGPGLYYADLNVNTGKYTSKYFTWGALGDSFFEYLLKIPILLGSKDKDGAKFLRMFKESEKVLETNLLKTCYDNKLCLGRISANDVFQAGTQHLEFFVPGLLLLGGQYLNDLTIISQGLKLLKTFQTIPGISATGLAPEYVYFSNSSPISIASPYNSLRPELAESLFYAHRYTHDPQYRESSWNLFQAFEKYSKVEHGYAEYRDVTSTDKDLQVQGHMPSYFFAETFKYLYLAFCPDTVLPLSEWVFNTEAHPFRINKN